MILDQYQLRQLHNEGRLVTSQRTPFADSALHEERKVGRSINAELYLGGQLDLEAPLSRVDPAQNAYAILSIPLSAPAQQTQQLPEGYEMPAVDVDVELPLHLRYQEPVLSRYLSKKGREGFGGSWRIKKLQPDERMDIVDVQVDWPCVFWACETEQPEAEASQSHNYASVHHHKLMSFCQAHRMSRWTARPPVSASCQMNSARPYPKIRPSILKQHTVTTISFLTPLLPKPLLLLKQAGLSYQFLLACLAISGSSAR